MRGYDTTQLDVAMSKIVSECYAMSYGMYLRSSMEQLRSLINSSSNRNIIGDCFDHRLSHKMPFNGEVSENILNYTSGHQGSTRSSFKHVSGRVRMGQQQVVKSGQINVSASFKPRSMWTRLHHKQPICFGSTFYDIILLNGFITCRVYFSFEEKLTN